MNHHSEKRHLSFSIDSILSHDDSKHVIPKYSPYKLDDATATSQQRLPSFGTEPLDARMREFTCGTDYTDEAYCQDSAKSPQIHSDQELSPDNKHSKSDEIISQSDSLLCKGKKKTRTVFSRQQVFYLEAAFDAKRYLSSAERSEIASSLSLSETQVKVWFQNRRNKWKAQLNGDGKIAPSHDSGPVFIPPFLCSTIAAQAQRGHHGLIPQVPYFRQSMFY